MRAAFPSEDAERLCTLTEAAQAAEIEVARLQLEYLELRTSLDLANARLARAWQAVDRFNNELATPMEPAT